MMEWKSAYAEELPALPKLHSSNLGPPVVSWYLGTHP